MFPLISYWCSNNCKLWASQHHSVQCTLYKIWQHRFWRLLPFLALGLLGQLAWHIAQAHVSSPMRVITSPTSPDPGRVSTYIRIRTVKGRHCLSSGPCRSLTTLSYQQALSNHDLSGEPYLLLAAAPGMQHEKLCRAACKEVMAFSTSNAQSVCGSCQPRCSRMGYAASK